MKMTHIEGNKELATYLAEISELSRLLAESYRRDGNEKRYQDMTHLKNLAFVFSMKARDDYFPEGRKKSLAFIKGIGEYTVRLAEELAEEEK